MAAGIFFFFFLFGNKKFLGLGEILCATAVPRGSPAPPPLPLPPVGERGEGDYLGRGKCGGKEPSLIPTNMEEKLSRAGREKCQQGETRQSISAVSPRWVGAEAPAAKSSGPASAAPPLLAAC